MSLAAWLSTAAALAAIACAGVRWLRVAQREHYLPGRVSLFAWRWWSLMPVNAPLGVVAVACALVSAWVPVVAFGTAAAVGIGPLGLGLRGRTAKLAWTRRLRTLAAGCGVLAAALVVVGILLHRGALFAAVVAVGVPVLVDLGLAVTRPLEGVLARRYVTAAAAIMRKVQPRVVAITGSYGKTSTKGYVNHLAKEAFEVVASPASYNNRAGLSRTVNDLVKPGIEVLVAEMGTYGPGEIAEMCGFVPPDIAVITAIGPVHLERFGSLERTLEAKSEITIGAATTVLATDDTLLAGFAERLEAAGRVVVRCSGTSVLPSGVSVLRVDDPSRLQLFVDGSLVGEAPVESDAVPASTSNVACAVAAVLALGVPAAAVVNRLGSLPVPTNRLQIHESASGFRIIDDTYNANPAGARVALERLAAAAAGACGNRRVVVTPGMIELGPRQFAENAAFGTGCAGIATDVLVVGRTNKRALLAGLNGKTNVVPVNHREDAVEWIKGNLAPGDVVLYENDLPDHFP